MDKLQCIEIIKSMNIIVGVLSTAQPVKFGKTNSGKPIYQIKPFKKILPPFWITYAGKLKGRIIIAFKFRDWKDDSKLPFGEIVEIIGIQDDSILTKTLMQHYEIDRKNFKKVIQLNSNETQIIRKDLKHLDVFSIDPLGCIDIDDALSLEKNNDKIYIGVHIAQPICWLTKEDILERSKKAFSTLYLNDSNKNLWSDELTENASLLQGKEKPAYSVIFEISNSKIINIESFPSTIINKLTTDYDSINFKNIIEVKEITEKILEKEIDSHELVSFWMVKTNEYIGNNFDNIPFRIQSEKNTNEIIKVSDIKIKTIFDNFMLEGAKYSYEKNYHFSLNISNYTHFTSPIRRIIDTIIHWNITYKNHQITINLDDINIIDNKTKKFHRQLKLIESIKNLPEEIETTGWVFSIKENKLMVYFKEIGLTKVKLWHDKFNYLNMENNVKIGMGYPFKIIKKVGFMPSEKLVILKI
jgi:exoribonuclease R